TGLIGMVKIGTELYEVVVSLLSSFLQYLILILVNLLGGIPRWALQPLQECRQSVPWLYNVNGQDCEGLRCMQGSSPRLRPLRTGAQPHSKGSGSSGASRIGAGVSGSSEASDSTQSEPWKGEGGC